MIEIEEDLLCHFSVEASDSGIDIQLTNRTSIYIRITPVNEYAPYFIKNITDIKVFEDVAINTTIAKVNLLNLSTIFVIKQCTKY